MRGISVASKPMSRKERKQTSYHEAGHAVLSHWFGGQVQSVRVGRETWVDATGQTVIEDGACARTAIRNRTNALVVCFAGILSDFLLCRSQSPSADDIMHNIGGDIDAVTTLTKLLAAEQSTSSDVVLQDAFEAAKRLVFELQRPIEVVARALLRQGRLETADIDALLGPMPVNDHASAEDMAAMNRDVAALNARVGSDTTVVSA